MTDARADFEAATVATTKAEETARENPFDESGSCRSCGQPRFAVGIVAGPDAPPIAMDRDAFRKFAGLDRPHPPPYFEVLNPGGPARGRVRARNRGTRGRNKR